MLLLFSVGTSENKIHLSVNVRLSNATNCWWIQLNLILFAKFTFVKLKSHEIIERNPTVPTTERETLSGSFHQEVCGNQSSPSMNNPMCEGQKEKRIITIKIIIIIIIIATVNRLELRLKKTRRWSNFRRRKILFMLQRFISFQREWEREWEREGGREGERERERERERETEWKWVNT